MKDIRKRCRKSGKTFIITQQEHEFYRSNDIPLPTESPAIRKAKRDAFVPTPYSTQGTCELCGIHVLIPYTEISGRHVICKPCSREKNPIDETFKEMEFDYIPGKFLESYRELLQAFPVIGPQEVINDEGGSEKLVRSTECSYCKNCYDSFDLSKCLNCVNTQGSLNCTDCIDCSYCIRCEKSVELVNCRSCYNCHMCEDCVDCKNLQYSDNCRGSEYCFGCSGLWDKKYCLFNKQYTKEEYNSKVKELLRLPQSEVEKRVEKELADIPVPASNFGNNEDCLYSTHTTNSKSCYWAFYSRNSMNSGYLWDVYDAINSWDLSLCRYNENCYNNADCSHCNNLLHSTGSRKTQNSLMCHHCYECDSCTGCVNLGHEKLHILNKKYSKEDYDTAVAKIRDELNLHYTEE